MQGVTNYPTTLPQLPQPPQLPPRAQTEAHTPAAAQRLALDVSAAPVLHVPRVSPASDATPHTEALASLFETLDQRLTQDSVEPTDTLRQRNLIARGFDFLIDALDRFRWAGSGHRAALASGIPPLPDPTPAPLPRMHLGRNGALDYVVAWLYFFSAVNAPTRAAIRHTSPDSPSNRSVDEMTAWALTTASVPVDMAPMTTTPTLQESAHLSRLRVRRHADTPDIENEIAGLLNPAVLDREIQVFYAALSKRVHAFDDARTYTERVIDLKPALCAEFERRIQAATPPHDAPPPRIEDIALTQFNIFGYMPSAPSYDDTYLERWRPRLSIPIADAAIKVLAGRLQIAEPARPRHDATTGSVRPDYGVHAGTLDRNHHYRAQDQVPGLSAADFLDVVGQWQWLTADDADAPQADAFVQALDPFERKLAHDDLQLSYMAGHISADAVVLGEIILHLPSALARRESDGQQAGVTAYRILVTIAGSHEPISPAGMFFVGSQPAYGYGLLYIAGDPHPWREYEDRDALMRDLTWSSGNGLHDLLKARLPRDTARHIITTVQLTPTPNDPLAGARHASLSVVRHDMRTDFDAATASGQIDQYISWFAGAAPQRRSDALRAADAASVPGIQASSHRSPALDLPENIARTFQSLLDMRAQISTQMPTQRRIARSLANEVLTELGAKDIDANDVRLTLVAPPSSPADAIVPASNVSYALPEAVLKQIDGALRTSPNQTVALSLASPGGDASAVSLPQAERLIGNLSAARFRVSFDRELRDFVSTHRNVLRKTVASTFALQAVAMQTHNTLGSGHISLAKSIAMRAGFDDLAAVLPGEDNRPFEHSWLSVEGITSLMMVLTDRDSGIVLLYSPTSPDAVLRGFKDRSALDAWLAAQVRDPAARAQIVDAFPASAHERVSAKLTACAAQVSPTTCPFDANGKRLEGDVFTNVLDTFLEHGIEIDGADDPARGFGIGVLLTTAHAIRWLDVGMGIGSWFGESLSPASMIVSAADGAFGLSLIVAGRGDMRTEGWYSLATAVGASGVSAARCLTFKDALLTDGYAYVFEGDIDDNDPLVDGLYYVGGQFVAQFGEDAASSTYAGLMLEADTGEFRLINHDLSSMGGYVRLGRDGTWRLTRNPPPGMAPAVSRPHVAYAVERAYGQRLSATMNAGTSAERQLFRAAKRQAYERSMLGQAQRLPSMTQKIRFLDPRITDFEALGTLAGEVESAQAAEAAAEDIANLAAEAAAAGATVRTVPHMSGTAGGPFDSGLVRLMAIASRDGHDGALLDELARLAQTPDASATATYIARVRALGRNEAARESFRFRGDAPNSVRISDLRSIFRGKASTPSTFEITTRDHGMLLGRRLTSSRDVEYFFFDPASSIVVDRNKRVIVERAVRHLSSARAAYSPYSIAGQPAVMVREVDVARLAESAAGTVRAGDLVPHVR
ncbi:dermonecrotic toxin domain-containing protein [Pandoraea pneumonica]|uniref:dermonecrotic toxin domain-containing protein n=1 Tax=Pandoraea pneumonica TaxID=2508299 RepID=UPI003CE7AF26